jgi:hypothetical protein
MDQIVPSDISRLPLAGAPTPETEPPRERSPRFSSRSPRGHKGNQTEDYDYWPLHRIGPTGSEVL